MMLITLVRFAIDSDRRHVEFVINGDGMHCSSTTVRSITMTCPQCGHEQPDVFSQCQKCRYIFPPRTVYYKKPPSIESSVARPNRGAPSAPAVLGAVVGVVILGATLWWLHSPTGLPVPNGAYVNQDHHFAMLVPEDWYILTAGNYKEMFEKLGDRFPKSIRDGLSQRRIEVGFLKLLEDADFSPNINIVVMEGDMPSLDETQLKEAAQALSAQFSRMLDKYQLERKELVTVDELTAAQFTSKTSIKSKVAESQPIYKETFPGWRTTIGQSPEEWKTYDMKMIQTLVPGKKRAYIITCTALETQYPDFRRAFNNAVDSFRVLQRPPRFGKVVMGALQGGIVGAVGYLLYVIVTALIGLLRR
ncbi:MAG: hypothetical protein FJ217_04045 [Ignavibacteria bacterium]|nr:hypothetical protein [Ignavibacteria bacterium]